MHTIFEGYLISQPNTYIQVYMNINKFTNAIHYNG